VDAAIGGEQGLNGFSAFVTQGEGIVVDIEVDVLAHDGDVHLLGVFLYIVGEAGIVCESVFEAAADKRIYFYGKGGVEVFAEDDAAQGDRGTGLFFPEFSEVYQFSQSFLPVGETIFMDDHAAVYPTGEDGVFDPGEYHELFPGGLGEGEGEEEVCGSLLPGDGDGAAVDGGKGSVFAGNQERADAFSECAACLQQPVLV